MEWINEPEAVGILRRHWDTIPRARVLRAHMRAQGALRRAGRDGCVMYSKDPVQDLASRFIPIADHLTGDELKSRAVRSILSGFAMLPMGSVKLVAVEDVPAVSRAMAEHRARSVSRAEIDTTVQPKSTQPAPNGSFKSVDNAA